MTIEAKTGIGKLQRAQDDLQHMIRRIARGLRLMHFDRMTSLVLTCAAYGIAQGGNPTEIFAGQIVSKRCVTILIDSRFG